MKHSLYPFAYWQVICDYLLSQFHFEGIEAGRRVEVFRIEAGIGEGLGWWGRFSIQFGARSKGITGKRSSPNENR